MPSLYDLTEQYRTLLDITDDDPEAFAFALSQLKDELADKAVSVAKVILHLQAEADVCAQEAARLQKRASDRRTRSIALQNYLKENMEAAGITSIRSGVVDLRIQNSPLSVAVMDEARVGSEWKRATLKMPLAQVPEELIGLAQTEVDRRGILDWVKAGHDAPEGTEVQQSTHLRIR